MALAKSSVPSIYICSSPWYRLWTIAANETDIKSQNWRQKRNEGIAITFRDSRSISCKFLQKQSSKAFLISCFFFKVTGSATAVRLSYCLDPGLFYVHPLSIAGPGLSELHRMESNMMQEMNEEFWSNVQNSLNSTNFWKGQLCAFRYDKSEREYDNWIYRVLIEKISRKLGMFQIFSIDYGWRQICKTTVRYITNLMFLSI